MSLVLGMLLLASAGAVGPAPPPGPQDPSSRRIDPTPRIVLRPEGAETGPRPVSRPGLADVPGRIPPPPAREQDRGLDLELDLKERREQLEGEDRTSHYVAAALVLVGSGVALLALLNWISKRRGG
jgi:hypothetical protein